MIRARVLVGILLSCVAVPAPAVAKCSVGKYLELPVTMVGNNPVVTIQINGRDARFLLDSGAFFSTIAKANAQDYGLPVKDLDNVRLTGIGGETSLGVVNAKEVTIGGYTFRKVDFAVGGSDTGFVGLLGQNLLGTADIEYDLPHAMVRIMKSDDCKTAGLAYWAHDRPYTMLPIKWSEGAKFTVASVTINGKTVDALFDSGAGTTIISRTAAKRIGVTPDSPGVREDGYVTGMGQKRVAAWRARFEAIDIGGEAIKRPILTIADQLLGDTDMLMGVDFFLTHRIYVDNKYHRMFVTYEGGPLFGLSPRGAVDETGARLDLISKAAEPVDAAGFSRRGALFATHGKLREAIADFDRALAMAPGQADYVYQRARVRIDNDEPLLAAADLDKAITLAPNDARARMARATMRLMADDETSALIDLKAADAALAPTADARLALADQFARR